MRVAIALLGLLVGVVPTQGQDVRSASERETVGLLQGCWREEPNSQGRYTLREHHDVCFGARGDVTTPMVSCSDEHGCTELLGRGTYVVADGKLKLSSPDSGNGWIFYRDLLCDVLIRPGRAFKLTNCVDPRSGDVISDRSFSLLGSRGVSP